MTIPVLDSIKPGMVLSCTSDKNILEFSMGQKFLSYPSYLTQAITRGMSIGCTRLSLVKVSSSCNNASNRIQGLLAAYFKMDSQW